MRRRVGSPMADHSASSTSLLASIAARLMAASAVRSAVNVVVSRAFIAAMIAVDRLGWPEAYKAAGAADSLTKGKYTDKIQTAGNKVEETVQKQAHKPTPGVNPTGTDAMADGGFTTDATGTTGAPGTAGAPDAGTAGRRPTRRPGLSARRR